MKKINDSDTRLPAIFAILILVLGFAGTINTSSNNTQLLVSTVSLAGNNSQTYNSTLLYAKTPDSTAIMLIEYMLAAAVICVIVYAAGYYLLKKQKKGEPPTQTQPQL